MNNKNLFLIDGAAGTGKSDLIEFVDEHLVGHKADILRKFTTRKLRNPEKRKKSHLDLEFIEEDEFNNLMKQAPFYHYRYPHKDGESYGFFRSDLELKLQETDNVFLIVRSAKVIKKITEEFQDINVIPVFIYTIENLIEKRLLKDNYSKEEINFRLSRSEEAMSDLYAYPALYKIHIINNSDKRTYINQLTQKFDEYIKPKDTVLQITAREHYHLPKPIRNYKDRIIEQLRCSRFEKNVFVMMSFEEKHDGTYNLIKLVVENAGFNCVRADKNGWSNITQESVYNPYAALYCCKYGIALFANNEEDDSKYNTNVAIELAMMVFQDKHCLMLKHKGLNSPPFDLANHIHKEYCRTEELVAIIQNWITKLD